VLLICVLQLSACNQSVIVEAEQAPAVVEPIGDSDLNRVTLTDRAAARLGIQVETIQEAVVGHTRLAPGEVITSGVAASVAVGAPDAGTISAVPGGDLPALGTRFRAGETVLQWRALVAVNGQNPTIAITAPQDSVLVRLNVATGQIVAAGQELFELTDPTQMWVRVPLSDSDLKKVDRQQAARVIVGTVGGGAGLSAHVVAFPGGGDAPGGYTQAALYYAPDRSDHGLTLGERARVELPLVGSGAKRLVVPYRAVLYDLDGEIWIYTSPQPGVFIRAPIVVDYVEGDTAVLNSGPPVGTAIATTGATELRGVEFGVGE
jgi:hypothetical protein